MTYPARSNWIGWHHINRVVLGQQKALLTELSILEAKDVGLIEQLLQTTPENFKRCVLK
jgi:hypothetical protein